MVLMESGRLQNRVPKLIAHPYCKISAVFKHFEKWYKHQVHLLVLEYDGERLEYHDERLWCITFRIEYFQLYGILH